MTTYDPDCIFCKIAAKEIPARIVWESATHMAFLTRWPNTEGFTVVIPKNHYPSYAFEVPDNVLQDITLAAKQVGKILDRSFPDVGRTAMVFEGFGVNHLHAKLIPLHGTKDETWRQRKINVSTYFESYQGYVSSHDAEEQPAAVLDATLAKITAAGS